MIDLILAGILGFFLGKAFEPETKQKEKKESMPKFYIWFNIEDSEEHYFDKAQLEFYDYDSAKKMYDKLVKNRQITVGEILEHSQHERDLRKTMEENAEKDGTPIDTKESAIVKIISIEWGLENHTFEEKELN